MKSTLKRFQNFTQHSRRKTSENRKYINNKRTWPLPWQVVSNFDPRQIQVDILFICCRTIFSLDNFWRNMGKNWSEVTLKAKQNFLITSLFNSVQSVLWPGGERAQRKQIGGDKTNNKGKTRCQKCVSKCVCENAPTRWILFVNGFKTRLMVCLSPSGAVRGYA